MEKLTHQEEKIMLLIWKHGPCFIKDILAKINNPKPPYTTVASIVKNLERKQYVKNKHYGNTYEYTPIISQEEYKSEFMDGFIGNYFENSYKGMVSFFAQGQKVSADDLKEIISLIEKGEE